MNQSRDLDFDTQQTIPFMDTTKSGLSSCGIHFFSQQNADVTRKRRKHRFSVSNCSGEPGRGSKFMKELLLLSIYSI